jgi:hypothetical protein
MDKTLKNRDLLLPFFFIVIIIYLVLNTGIISDDYIFMSILKGQNPLHLLVPKQNPGTPVETYFFFMWYPLFRLDNMAAVNILKVLYIILAFYMVSRFFSIFLDKRNTALASFLFLFFPSHDSTVYWFLGQYLTLSIAFYLYAYYLAFKDRLILASVFAILGSFISYGSSVIAVSLFLIFALHREFKKGLTLLIPNILYSAYYVFISKFLATGPDRLPDNFDIYGITKHFFLQIPAFLDATLGPSMWLKIYWAIEQLSAPSIVISIIAAVFFYRLCAKPPAPKYNKRMILGLVAMTILSFLMFAATGYYPQLAFNLGNRTTIFGSLLMAYIVVLLPAGRIARTIILSILLLSILGISDHWKLWSIRQQEVITDIANNPDLKKLNGIVYVSGNQYSKFGKLSHIEFLCEDQVGVIFEMVLGKGIEAKPLNKRHRFENGYILDTKYGTRDRVEDYVTIYDSEKDRIIKLRTEDINSYINSLPYDTRHWIQLTRNSFLRGMILKAIPRLKYTL